ncbi:MAG: Hsp20/alpha crystallin family protein [Kiritimatiellae bacterium]|nr:Hsp20/alpha crystallin family protein [Kiritimatiellia bacterium]
MESEKYIVPAATFAEKPEEYEIKIILPGIGKEDAELHVEGRTLTLKTRSKFQNPAGFKQVASEFEHANYSMSADLPELADASTLSAKMESGVLAITVKKRPESQPKKIAIC